VVYFIAQGVEVEAVTSNRLNWVKKTFGDLVFDKIRLEGNGRFKVTSALGQLEVAVVYYRQFSKWHVFAWKQFSSLLSQGVAGLLTTTANLKCLLFAKLLN
jgi:hypothetical protein